MKKLTLSVVLGALLMLGVASIAQASEEKRPWVPEMNQVEYWETEFDAICIKDDTSPSGTVTEDYDWVIAKAGSDYVLIFMDVQANSLQWAWDEKDISWIIMCNATETPPSTTTTFNEETTTTFDESTTTTQRSETTTTEDRVTTTTIPYDSTTTTLRAETTTSTTTVQVPIILPNTGLGTDIFLGIAAAALLLGAGLLVKGRRDE